ncbi:family 16 glycoside hydrolase [Pseudopedobacter saltans]|nr:family 16 glycoside hydrolase [Pseudopedobacter saltans]
MKKISLIASLMLLFITVQSLKAQVTNINDLYVGDWKDAKGERFVQIFIGKEGDYKGQLLDDITLKNKPLVMLSGKKDGNVLTLSGDGWEGKVEKDKLMLTKGAEKLSMSKYFRTSPTMGEKAPKGAVVLFNGKDLNAWSKAGEKEWIDGSGPADNWKILPEGILEAVPGAHSIMTKQKFGDIKLHLEFRLLGQVTNGGVYLMSRYEVNIKDAFGQPAPIAMGNISKPATNPSVNVAFPPFQWQTLDIDFQAPRFDATGTKKTANAKITVVHNGVTIYKDLELEEVKGSTGKLGEAGVGPVYLQEHGTAYQFRNIWLVDKTIKGTEKAFVAGSEEKKGGSKGGKSGGGGKKGGSGEEMGTGEKKGGAGNKNGEAADTKAVVRKGGSSKKKADPTYVGEKNPAYANVTVSLTADPSGKPAKSAGFIHPGVLVNGAQLAELKRRVAAGIEPQKSAFEALKNSPFGALDYRAQPRDTVSCGPYSNPNLGCKDEQNDCAAAYSQALMWAITGNKVYAENAIQIMNAWSKNLVGGHNYANGPIQAAWTGSVWPRAAEIIRYTFNGWSDSDVAKFQNMLRVQYVPSLVQGDCENGNKELAMAEALINIGVFNDDRAIYDLGIKMWRGRTKAYIYLKSDGPTPIEPPGCGPAIWSNKGLMPELVDGILQETARDAHHPGMAFASIANAAETARQQGLDLYAEEAKRMVAALEFTAQYLAPNNKPKPENLEFSYLKTWEIAYNHYVNRLGMSLPYMKAVIPKNRPTGVDHHMVWETLTHGEIGNIGLPTIMKK